MHIIDSMIEITNSLPMTVSVEVQWFKFSASRNSETHIFIVASN